MKFNNKNIAIAFFLSFVVSHSSKADEYFHSDLLKIGGGIPENSELSGSEYLSFLGSSSIPPGKYFMDVFVNNEILGQRMIEFIIVEKNNRSDIYPCLSASDFYDLGLKIENNNKINERYDCVDFDEIDGVVYNIDWQFRALNISMPNIYIDRDRQWEARKGLWDDGISNAFVNYNLFGYKRNDSKHTRYLNLRSGVNIGPWRYRNYSVWQDGYNNKSKWNSISNTISRSIISLDSELTLGDSNSNSRVFSGFGFRGMNLRSSDQMRPNWESSYVPAVSGVAASDSLLTISQAGNVIYQNKIPAGPYSISDYYPASYGGELEVRLEGVDGKVNEFTIPFASIPVLERKGRVKYDLSVGRYRSSYWAGDINKNVAQLDMSYGLTNFTTIYGGWQASADYQSYALGFGQNLGVLGAIATDIKFLNYKIRENDLKEKKSSQALQINYAKGISETNTSIILDWRKALDDHYLSLSESMDGFYSNEREKSHFGLSINQGVPDNWGSISGSFYQVKYQNGSRINTYNIGYSNSYNGISYGLYWQYNNNVYRSNYLYEENKSNTNQVMFTVSIPLSRSDNAIWAGYSVSRANSGHVQQTANLSGSALDSRFNWGVNQGYGNHGYGYTGSARASYLGSKGTVSVGYGYSHADKSTDINYGLSGAVTLSEYGLTLSPERAETNAMIVAPGAEGISIINTYGVSTDGSGNAVLSGLSAYRSNRISIDVNSIPDDVDLKSTINIDLYPTKGALVLSEFKTEIGYKVFFKINNEKLPVGSKAYINGSDDHIMLGSFNQLFAVVDEKDGNVKIEWGTKETVQECSFTYDLNVIQAISGYYYMDVDCLREAEGNELRS